MKSKQTVEMFYDVKTGKYPVRLGDRYVPLSSGDVELHLRNVGISKENHDGVMNGLERAFFVTQTERSVDYSAPLAGHDLGAFRTSDGRRILVTSCPRLVEAKRGKWDWTRERFEELLGDQFEHFIAWLKCAVESLERRDFKPGQILILAGKPNCGKSFLQWCITQCFGGRCADPLLWLRGGTTFNGSLSEAEHWAIEDPGSATRGNVRRDFGDAIKRAVINREVFVHPKGGKGITVQLWRRLTMSVNEEVENISALPPLDDSMKDKVMMFKCGVATLSEDALLNQKRFRDELPALLYFCKQFNIPKALRCPRMGIVSFHHHELVEALTVLSPEQHLIELIDEVIFANGSICPFVGSAERLKQELMRSEFRLTVEKLLYYSSACGVYLERLSKRNPERVSSSRLEGKTRWTVKSPH